jgi:membrane-bound lytic murein transglycosylase D
MLNNPDIFAMETISGQPAEGVKIVAVSNSPSVTTAQQVKKTEVAAPVKIEVATPPNAEPLKSDETKATGSDENTGNGLVFHKVADGETLSDIATQFGITVADIKKWNDLSDGMKPGMELVVGLGGSKKPAVDKKPATVAPVATEHRIQYHAVATGETLYHISVMYKTTVIQLREWNNLPDNNISVGQNLVVGK